MMSTMCTIFAGALDQTRDIRHDEAAKIAQFNDPQHRLQCRERIGGDLGSSGRAARDQGALARVGQAHETDIGDQLQFEPEVSLLARPARLALARRLMRRAGEGLVAPAASAALADEDFDTGLVEIFQQQVPIRIIDKRPRRHAYDQILTVGAMLVTALAVTPISRPPMMLAGKIQQRIEVTGRLEIDVSASTAIASVRSPFRDELLPPEADAPAASVTGLDPNFRFVDKHLLWKNGHEFDLNDSETPTKKRMAFHHPLRITRGIRPSDQSTWTFRPAN